MEDKLKKRIKIIAVLSCVCLLSLAAFALSSCALKKLTKEELQENGFVHTVTIDFQGGGNSSTLMVKDGSVIPEPGTLSETSDDFLPKPTRIDNEDKIGYTLEGYFRGTVDDKGVVTYGEKWNFATDKVKENVTIYAKWRKNYSIKIHYFDLTAPKEAEGNTTYEENITYVEVKENADGTPQSVTKSSLKISLYTMLDYFYDADLKTPLQFDENEKFTPTSDQLSRENIVLDIWATTLKGSWKVIKSVDELKHNFVFGAGINVYLLCDIDMNDIYGEVDWKEPSEWNATDNGVLTEDAKKIQTALSKFNFPEDYSGKFYGNGHVISNVKINHVQALGKSDRYFGIFKTLTGKAEIKDVTFENATVNVNITNSTVKDYFVGMLAGKTDSKTVIEKVNVSGELHCNITEKNQVAELNTPYPFTGDNMAYCKPKDCDYSQVKIKKNGEWILTSANATSDRESASEPETAE